MREEGAGWGKSSNVWMGDSNLGWWSRTNVDHCHKICREKWRVSGWNISHCCFCIHSFKLWCQSRYVPVTLLWPKMKTHRTFNVFCVWQWLPSALNGRCELTNGRLAITIVYTHKIYATPFASFASVLCCLSSALWGCVHNIDRLNEHIAFPFRHIYIFYGKTKNIKCDAVDVISSLHNSFPVCERARATKQNETWARKSNIIF